VIPVSVSDYPGQVNFYLLPPEERARIELVGMSEASYFLSNHRQPEHFECFRTGKPPCANEIHAVRVDGARLLSVYKLR